MKWSLLLLMAIVVSLPLIRPAGPQQTALADFLFIVLVLLAWPTFWRTRQVLRLPLLGPEWLILVGSLIAALSSAYPVDAATTLIRDLYIYVWFVTVCNVIEPQDLPWLGRAWVLASAAEAGLICLGTFAHVGALANEWGRGMGTFLNPNMAASYMVTSFFVYLATPFPRSRALRVAIGALLILGVLATGSNAALPGLALGLVVVVAYRMIQGRSALEPWFGLAALGAALLGLVVLLGAPLDPAALSRLQGSGGLLAMTVGRLGGGIASRVQIWTGAWQSFQQHPLGLGPGVSSIGLGGELHNDFLSHLVERGILGLVGLVWAVVVTLVVLLRSAQDELQQQLLVANAAAQDKSKTKILKPQRHEGTKNSMFLNSKPSCLHAFVVKRPWLKAPVDTTGGWDWVGPLLGGFVAALPIMLSHEILHFRHHWMLLALIFASLPLELQSWRQVAARSWAWILHPSKS